MFSNYFVSSQICFTAKAKCKQTGTEYALKRIKFNKEDEKRNGFSIQLLREISFLLQLKHANIVEAKEVVVGSDSHKLFLVLEYCPMNLLEFIQDKQRVEHSFHLTVQTIMRQLLNVVSYLHEECWIMHRDIKPTNILIASNGTIKLCDFGMARKYEEPLQSMTPNCSTLWYRSIEQLLGQKMYNKSVDVWSIGCLFFELLTGKVLFEGNGEIEQIRLILNVLGRPTEEHWKGMSELPVVKSFYFANNLPDTSQLHEKLSKELLVPFENENQFTFATNLMNQLLIFDPSKRMSAKLALKHPYFQLKFT